MKNQCETNSYYMGLVQNLYAGHNGCLTAFLQFFYQFVINKNEESFHECFQKLYEREIENCGILGEILFEMGGDPQFFSSSRKFLNLRSVNYVKDIDKGFLRDIEFLEVNIIDLKGAISKIDDFRTKEKLKEILANKKDSLKTLKENYFKNKIVQ